VYAAKQPLVYSIKPQEQINKKNQSHAHTHEKILKSVLAVGEFWRNSGERRITSNWIALQAKISQIDTYYT